MGAPTSLTPAIRPALARFHSSSTPRFLVARTFSAKRTGGSSLISSRFTVSPTAAPSSCDAQLAGQPVSSAHFPLSPFLAARALPYSLALPLCTAAWLSHRGAASIPWADDRHTVTLWASNSAYLNTPTQEGLHPLKRTGCHGLPVSIVLIPHLSHISFSIASPVPFLAVTL